VRRFAAAVVMAAFLAVLGAEARGQAAPKGQLQKAIAAAKSKVYPALTNITVVMRRYQGGRPVRIPGSGSGVIVSKEGHVLTNFHVAGGATRLVCTLTTNEAIEADVVAHDPLTDISVLKLRLEDRDDPKKPIPFASLGDSDALQVGDYVLAMGNPRGLSSSMTLGIVANTKRVFTGFAGAGIQERRLDEGEATGLLTRWIQHDALIMPGNSGGPLVDLAGNVIGINELGGQGMAFAIPSNLAARVMRLALEKGEITRGWVGLAFYPVDKLGLTTGTLISSVLGGSPAEKAGLVAGDVLLSIDGQALRAIFFEEVPLLYQRIAELAPGAKSIFKILRDGKEQDVEVEVALMEDSMGRQAAVPSWGVTVREITGPMALSRRYPNTNGVLITGVRAGNPAGDAKPPLPNRCVVLEVGGKPVTTLDSFLELVKSTAGETDLLVRFRRGGQDVITALDTSDKPDPKRGRELAKAWIGVRTQVLTTDVARALGLKKVRGFRITEIFRGTEAEKAGLKVGDIVTAIDGEKLRASRLQDGQMWRRKVETLVIETEAELKVRRGEEKMTICVMLQETPTSSIHADTHKDEDLEFGVRAITFMDQISRRWDPNTKGVVVTSAATGGWANLAGLVGGDVIQRIQGKDVPDIDTFKKVLEEIKSAHPDTIRLFVRRGFQTAFVFIEPDWDQE
jgi:serine protease Do